MYLCDTHFDIDKDTPSCCCNIPQELLDFNTQEVSLGYSLSCKNCGRKYVLLMSEGFNPTPKWCMVRDSNQRQIEVAK